MGKTKQALLAAVAILAAFPIASLSSAASAKPDPSIVAEAKGLAIAIAAVLKKQERAEAPTADISALGLLEVSKKLGYECPELGARYSTCFNADWTFSVAASGPFWTLAFAPRLDGRARGAPEIRFDQNGQGSGRVWSAEDPRKKRH